MIKRPYPAQIVIQTANGKARIDAVIVGNLAAHISIDNDSVYPYTVSHVETGLAIPYDFPTEEAAVCFAYRINALFKHPPECDLDNPEYVAWVSRIKSAIKDAALAEGGAKRPTRFVRKGGRWVRKPSTAKRADESAADAEGEVR